MVILKVGFYMQDYNNKGFTLVELAIVITIIGMLIGGVLKGEEMIRNAEISSTVADMKALQGAINNYRFKYDALAGDMDHATTSLANCDASTNCTDGDGNSLLNYGNSYGEGMTGTPTSTSSTREKWLFWKHLALSGIIKGIDISDNGTERGLLKNDIGGYFHVGHARGTSNCGIGTNMKKGLWLTLSSEPGAGCTSTTGVFEVKKIASIDKKIDDGMPNSGGFRAGQDSSLANCVTTFSGQTIYNRADETSSCTGLFWLE